MERLCRTLLFWLFTTLPALACRNDSDIGSTESGLRSLADDSWNFLHPSLGVLVPTLSLLVFFWWWDRRKR